MSGFLGNVLCETGKNYVLQGGNFFHISSVDISSEVWVLLRSAVSYGKKWEQNAALAQESKIKPFSEELPLFVTEFL